MLIAIKAHRCAIFTLGFATLLPLPALAIPSPELVIGSAASLSQIFGFVAAMLGGGALFAGRRAGKNTSIDPKTARRLSIVAVILVGLAISSVGLNIYQYRSTKADTLARLQATLVRPAVIKDRDLVETSFTDQSRNQLGISTQDLADALDSDSNILFVDVRENAEFQMGTIPGAQHIRFPDVDPKSPEFRDKQVVLVCHNGNRSSETCAKLAALGIDCKFVVGGIEKWIVEGRRFTDPTVRTLSDLRAIPDYPNKDTLLDTPAVQDLISSSDVQIIDVRYPDDFASGHLPGAVNFPLRATPTPEVIRRIAALSDKPVVTPCYDRRGCFISQVLGYELAQAGLDFRGRYTQPWEYFTPAPPKPHVAAWLAAQNESTWQAAIRIVAGVLGQIAEKSNFLVAIFGLAILSRLAILPISVKAERDQLVTAGTANELAEIKEKYKNDPPGKTAALKSYYERNGLTPFRNMLALLFLPVTMLGLSSVQSASVNQPGIWWLDSLGTPDPTYLLPGVATLLANVYLAIALGKTRRRLLVGLAIGLPLMLFLTVSLSAAGNVYLIIALCLLFLQRAFVTGKAGSIWPAVRKAWRIGMVRYRYHGIVPLQYTDLLLQAGNKAYRLSKLSREGLPVPDGVVLTHDFLEQFLRASTANRTKLLGPISKLLGNGPFAVRSSATAEDGGDLSFAGVFESRLDVAQGSLEDAILGVTASFTATHTLSYADGGRENILIQNMVAADYAGVLFTQDPTKPGQATVEMVEGTAEELVSARVTPGTFHFGRFTGQSLDAPAPIDLSKLLKFGQQIERIFSTPQDIEWTCRGGQFSIVQSRDITTLGTEGTGAVSLEWLRLFSDFSGRNNEEVILQQDEMSEVLPKPTPLSLSYMSKIWSRGGSVDLACQKLGIAYKSDPRGRSHLTTVFGRLYSDTKLKRAASVEISSSFTRRFNRDSMAIFEAYHKGFLPRFETRMAELRAMNFDAMSNNTLTVQLCRMFDEFLADFHVEVEVINIVADYCVRVAVSDCKRAEHDPAKYLTVSNDHTPAACIHHMSDRDTAEQMATLREGFGHRAMFDYELSHQRYREDDDLLRSLLDSAQYMAPRSLFQEINPGGSLQKSIKNAKLYLSLKESAKHQVLRHLAEIRRAVECLDQKLHMNGLLHFLNLNELPDLADLTKSLRQVATNRRANLNKLWAEPPLGAELSVKSLEKATAKGCIDSAGIDTGSGTRVSGDTQVFGIAYKVDRAMAEAGVELPDFRPGHILVCSHVHPSWLPYVLMSSGVLSEVGGWLSHIAIVAREHNVPLVVGLSDWDQIGNGCHLTIEPDGHVVVQEGIHDKTTASVAAS